MGIIRGVRECDYAGSFSYRAQYATSRWHGARARIPDPDTDEAFRQTRRTRRRIRFSCVESCEFRHRNDPRGGWRISRERCQSITCLAEESFRKTTIRRDDVTRRLATLLACQPQNGASTILGKNWSLS